MENTTSTAAPQRFQVLDALRGLAIVGVVVGHANLGILQMGLSAEYVPFFKGMHFILYSLHLPLLAFLLGANISLSLSRTYRPQKVWMRILDFIYLYLVWTFIQGSYEVFGSQFANNATTWKEVFNLLNPLAHLWFLPWAIMVYACLGFVRPWRSLPLALVVLLVFVVLTPLFWGVNNKVFYTQGIAIIIFSLLGALGGKKFILTLSNFSSLRLLLLTLVSGLPFLFLLIKVDRFTLPTLEDTAREADSVFFGICIATTGTLFLLFLFFLLYQKVQLRFLEFIGFNSLAIYLSHLLFVPPVRVLGVKAGLDDMYLLLLVASVLGLAFSCLFVFLARHPLLKWTLVRPTLSQKKSS